MYHTNSIHLCRKPRNQVIKASTERPNLQISSLVIRNAQAPDQPTQPQLPTIYSAFSSSSVNTGSSTALYSRIKAE